MTCIPWPSVSARHVDHDHFTKISLQEVGAMTQTQFQFSFTFLKWIFVPMMRDWLVTHTLI